MHGESHDDDDVVPPSCDEEDPIPYGVPLCDTANDGSGKVPKLQDVDSPSSGGHPCDKSDDDDKVSQLCDKDSPQIVDVPLCDKSDDVDEVCQLCDVDSLLSGGPECVKYRLWYLQDYYVGPTLPTSQQVC